MSAADTQTRVSGQASTELLSRRPRLTHRLVGMMKRHPIKSVGLAGVALSMGYHHYYSKEDDGSDKKQVLVLPFYKMRIVEDSRRDFRSMASSRLGGGGDKTIEMNVDEVVHLIHQAADDPNIVAVYGILGHGHGFSTGGWAHVEEIRNALLVFQQSHRTHKEPNANAGGGSARAGGATTSTTSALTMNPTTMTRRRKPLYCYTNTFASPMGGGADMKEYYLASAFTHIHLQPQGDLNLFGLHATNTFWRDFLGKYGIQVHVWKHGLYKNFANQVTHASYSTEHKENVQNILVNINNHVCHGIYTARNASLKNFEFSNFWEMVHRAGSFPADMAQKIGFVDYLPKLDPLNDLVASNGKKDNKDKDATTPSTSTSKEDMEKKWGKDTDMHQFQANATISIDDYARRKKQEKDKDARQWKYYQMLQGMAKSTVGMSQLLSLMGYAAPYYNIPKVCVACCVFV
jgi:hypothetical protein